MNKKTIEWYSDRHYQPSKVIKAGRRRGLHPYFTKEAMKHCYKKIQDGKEINDIEIGRYIFNKAKNIRAERRDERFADEENYTGKIKRLIYPLYALSICYYIILLLLIYKVWWS